MKSIIEFLKGKRTYITAALMFITAGATAVGWIDQKTMLMIDGFLAPFGFGFLRAGLNNSK